MPRFCPPKYLTQALREKGINLNKVVQEHYAGGGKDSSLSETLVNAGLKKKDADLLSDNITRRIDEYTQSKKAAALEGILREKIKDPNQRKVTISALSRAKNPGAFDETKVFNGAAKQLNIGQVDPEFRKAIRESADNLQKFEPGTREHQVALGLLNAQLGSIKKPGFADKLFGYARLNLLSNPINALVKNPSGNLANAVADFFAKGIYYTVTGKFNVFMKALGEAGGAFKQGFKEGIEDVKLDINTKNLTLSNIEPGRVRTFEKGSVLYNFEKVIDYSLRPVDYAFANAAKQFSLISDMLEAGVTKPTEEMLKRANWEAEKAIFTNPTVASEMVKKLSQIPGLGKFYVPFVTVPANMISKGIEYSPLKLVGTAVDLASLKFGFKNPFQVSGKAPAKTYKDIGIDTIKSLGLGSLVSLSTGYLLNQMGVLIPGGQDREDRAIMEAMGIQPGSLKIGKFEVGPFQLGGFSVDVKSLQPLSITFLIGAAMSEAQRKGDKNMLANLVGETYKFIKNDTVVKNVVDGLKDTGLFDSEFKQASNDDIIKGAGKGLGDTVGNAVNQLIPASSFIRSARQGISGKVTENYDPNSFKQAGNQLMGGFLAQGESKINILGEEVKKGNERFSPLKARVERESDKAILQELQKTGALKFVKKVEEVNGERMQLSQRQYLHMQKYTGKKRKEVLGKVIGSQAYKSLNAKTQADLLGGIETSIKNAGKFAVLGDVGMSRDRLAEAIYKGEPKKINKELNQLIKKEDRKADRSEKVAERKQKRQEQIKRSFTK